MRNLGREDSRYLFKAVNFRKGGAFVVLLVIHEILFKVADFSLLANQFVWSVLIFWMNSLLDSRMRRKNLMNWSVLYLHRGSRSHKRLSSV